MGFPDGDSLFFFFFLTWETHFTATLASRLVAVGIKPFGGGTVAGAAGLVTPPASRTGQVSPAEAAV